VIRAVLGTNQLDLQEHSGIPIVTARQFLAIISQATSSPTD
jgi:hypothetical protein